MIARLTRADPGATSQARAVLWSILAGVGFAGTFALGQAAIRAGADLPVILTTRAVSIATICVVFLLVRHGKRLDPRQLPLLLLMGALDALALGLVLTAGSLPHPEFAALASSLFGLVTILLAWAFLREAMTAGQWGSVLVVFAGIGYLAL
jgi:drug/metabolite transporter (DMT)-like permease